MRPRSLVISATLLLGVVAADAVFSRRAFSAFAERTSVAAADCLGSDSIIEIVPGRIGALRLDLPLAELRRRCAHLGWTTTNGDETLDIAVLLTRGVSLNATWNDLRRAYGQLGAFALNGTVYSTICRQPGITVEMDLARPDAPINPVNGEAQRPALIDSIMGGTPIAVVEVSSAPRRSVPC